MDAVRTYGPFALAAACGIGWMAMQSGANAPYAILPALIGAVAVCVGLIGLSTRWGTLATAALNAGCSWYLFQGKLDATRGYSLCSIDSVFDCGRINDSPWSEAFGVPITLLGTAFYAGLALAGLLSPKGDKDDGRFDQLNALFAIGTSLYSLFLLYISKQLGAVCVFCFTMYAGNFALLYAGFKGMREKGRTLLQDLGSLATTNELGTIVVVFALATIGGSQQWTEAKAPLVKVEPGAKAKPSQLAALYTKPCAEPVLDGTEPILGNPDAPILVVEWADFGCPHCAMAANELKELVSERPDVQVRFKYFPLSGMCNPALEDNGTGAERCVAALAAECARSQGKFWEMSKLLFANQGHFELDELRFMANQAGLDAAAWETCLESPESIQTVAGAGKAGGDVCIAGTPAMFVKGLTSTGWIEMARGVPGLLALIEAAGDGVELPLPTGT